MNQRLGIKKKESWRERENEGEGGSKKRPGSSSLLKNQPWGIKKERVQQKEGDKINDLCLPYL